MLEATKHIAADSTKGEFSIAKMKAEYLAMGGERSNAAYGYIAKDGREFEQG